jgi:hypothetical protein
VIEALGLELIELLRIRPKKESPGSGDGVSPDRS